MNQGNLSDLFSLLNETLEDEFTALDLLEILEGFFADLFGGNQAREKIFNEYRARIKEVTKIQVSMRPTGLINKPAISVFDSSISTFPLKNKSEPPIQTGYQLSNITLTLQNLTKCCFFDSFYTKHSQDGYISGHLSTLSSVLDYLVSSPRISYSGPDIATDYIQFSLPLPTPISKTVYYCRRYKPLLNLNRIHRWKKVELRRGDYVKMIALLGNAVIQSVVSSFSTERIQSLLEAAKKNTLVSPFSFQEHGGVMKLIKDVLIKFYIANWDYNLYLGQLLIFKAGVGLHREILICLASEVVDPLILRETPSLSIFERFTCLFLLTEIRQNMNLLDELIRSLILDGVSPLF